MVVERVNPPSARWIGVVFLQGEEANQAFQALDRGGPSQVIELLRRRDHGDETVNVALTNGYVYDRIPAGSTDLTIEDTGSPYALTYSRPHGYVSLLRRYSAMPDPELVPEPSSARINTGDVWFPGKGRPTNKAGRTVAL